jgi:hypothetical protein
MIDFIRPLLSSALKDNPHLQFAVMTGCLRISKESIFTGLNNLEVVSILSDFYSERFGFTGDYPRAEGDGCRAAGGKAVPLLPGQGGQAELPVAGGRRDCGGRNLIFKFQSPS